MSIWRKLFSAADLPGHSHQVGSFDRPAVVSQDPAPQLRHVVPQVYSIHKLADGYILASDYGPPIFCQDIEVLTDAIKAAELQHALERSSKAASLNQPVPYGRR